MKVLEGPLPGESKGGGFAEMARETSEAPTRDRLLATVPSVPPLGAPEIVQEQNRAVGFSPRAQLEGAANGPQAEQARLKPAALTD